MGFDAYPTIHIEPLGALQEYAGEYGTYKVTLEGGSLFLRVNPQRNWRLIPLSEDVFKLSDNDRQGYTKNRVQFTRDGKGRVKALFILDHDGNRYPVQSRK